MTINSVTASGTLFVLSAPSGAGKTTLTKALVDRLNTAVETVTFSTSYTTRTPRPGEKNGEDYHFVSVGEFQQLIADGQFLEHAEVFGNFYGTGKPAVQQQLAAGLDVILEIDWQGAELIRKAMPGCVSVFILPPSRPELERRLRGRGQDSEEVIAGRLAEAVGDMAHYQDADYLIINDDFEQALNELWAVFLSQRAAVATQSQRHSDLLAALLAE